MAGGGSIQPLLKNNKNLLRKKRFFKKDKSISERKKELLKNHIGELQFKDVTSEELQTIKEGIRKKAKRRNLKNIVYLGFVFLLVTCLIIFNHLKTIEHEKELQLKATAHLNQEHLKKYNAYIEDGENQFKKHHWKNAIYFYKKALIVKPNDSLASIRLLISNTQFNESNSQ